ncbi:MAG: hypothetical protein ACTHYD_09575 [Canibacter sp.]
MRDRDSAPPVDDAQFDVEPLAEVPQARPPINWWKLNAHDRRDTLRLLTEWVPEFVRRYAIVDQVVPPCWYQHEALIQELLGLYQAREHAAFDEYAAPTAPNDFHYQLDLFKHRARGLVSQFGCNVAEHFETALPHWVLPGARSALWSDEVSAFIQEGDNTGWPAWKPTTPDGEENTDDY